MNSKYSVSPETILAGLEAPKGQDNWLAEIQEQGLSLLQEQGFPTRKVEMWKYTNIEKLVEKSFKAQSTAANADIPVIENCYEIVFVDGLYQAELSSTDLPAGVTVAPLSEALKSEGELIQSVLAKPCPEAVDSFTHLNRAFFTEGAFVKIARKTIVDKPIRIVHFHQTAEAIAQPRNVIVIEDQAEAEILEEYTADRDSELCYFSNAVTDIQVAQAATLRHYKNQSESTAAYHIASTRVKVARDANYQGLAFNSGSLLARHNIDIELNGENAHATANGLYTTKDNQLSDTHSVINHNLPHTTCEQLYKGILDDRSRAIFNGKVHIVKDAQKSDSNQLNKNILLNKSARVDTKPELEVYADDVKAAHGATIGQLDEEELFYLQSRCIDKEAAVSLLIHAFMNDIILQIKNDSIRAYINTHFDTFFDLKA